MSDEARPAEDGITDTKPPWNPTVVGVLAILCGFGAAGVLAGLNYRRLGKPHLTWPTIGITVGAFAALLVTLSFFVGELGANAWLPYAVNVPPAFLLVRLQRSDYEMWKKRFPSAPGPGWGLPVMIGAGSLAIVLAVLFAAVLVSDGPSEAEEHVRSGVDSELESGDDESGLILDQDGDGRVILPSPGPAEISGEGHLLGSADAPVTVIVYTDFQ